MGSVVEDTICIFAFSAYVVIAMVDKLLNTTSDMPFSQGGEALI